jgi:nucleotide-binding universal stress UspA family protein
MFEKILHANDGSGHAFRALALAIQLAKQNQSELHIVCVEELPYLPELIEDVREAKEAAARRYEDVIQRARKMAEDAGVRLVVHILAGHPVRNVVELAAEIKADLLVIGARGHSALYERMIGSRADRLMQLAQCPVLVVK